MSAPVPSRSRLAGLLFAGALMAIAGTSRASADEVAAPPARVAVIASAPLVPLSARVPPSIDRHH